MAVLALAAALAPRTVLAAVRNSLMLNEANTVSGNNFLESNKFDSTLGRLQGNGQNWMEFIVVQGDDLGGGAFGNTLDLRGWKIDWSYNKLDPLDPNKFGSGTIQFSNDPLWAAMPRGTMLTINEWQKVWYAPGSDGAGGLDRKGGIAGLGQMRGDPMAMSDTLKDFSTDTKWNPNANGGGAAGDWNIHVWAGERNPDTSFKYFTFTGSVVDGDPLNPIAIGTDLGGLYAVNNDNWQWTIKDAANNVIQGPYGETGTGVTAISPFTGLPTAPNWSVNSGEIFRLEAFAAGTNPTQATYLNSWLNDYQDGSSSSYGERNVWSGGSGVQDLGPLRDWLQTGDINLDGAVDGADFLAWQRGLGTAGPSLFNGDLDGDRSVTGDDLAIWKNNFGTPAVPAASSVPECSSALLAVLAAMGAWTRRWAGLTPHH